MIAEALSLEGTEQAWRLPAVVAGRLPHDMPTAVELRTAIATLGVPPVGKAHVRDCMARLSLAFEGVSKLSDAAQRARCEVWREANGDLGEALWNEATLWCLRNHKFGMMPTPADFRRAVIDGFTGQRRKLDLCHRVLGEVEAWGRRKREQPDPEEEERQRIRRENEVMRSGPPDQARRLRARRLRDIIASHLKYGMTDRAAATQARLDEIERQQRAAGEVVGDIARETGGESTGESARESEGESAGDIHRAFGGGPQ